MENKDYQFMTHQNDSDVGYFDDFFIEEIKKEIKDTLLELNENIVLVEEEEKISL